MTKNKILIGGRHALKKTKKMQAEGYISLKSCNLRVRFHQMLDRHGACPSYGEMETALNCDALRKYILQASNQKTPDLNEKSRAALMCSCRAHSACMLFSGAGVPLIRMFQNAALFLPFTKEK